jgi:hypothetical protein
MVRIYVVFAFFSPFANNHGCTQSSVTSVAAQTGQSLSSSYGRSFTVPPTSTEKGALGPDCPSDPLLASDALILSRNGDDATKLLSTNAAKGPSGTDDSVSNVCLLSILCIPVLSTHTQLSVTALGLNPATLSTSSIDAIASVDSHRNVLLVRVWSDFFFPPSLTKRYATNRFSLQCTSQKPQVLSLPSQ